MKQPTTKGTSRPVLRWLIVLIAVVTISAFIVASAFIPVYRVGTQPDPIVTETPIPPTTGNEITTFTQCVAAGNPIMESAPPKCRTADGKLFVATASEWKPGSTDPNTPSNPAGGTRLANPYLGAEYYPNITTEAACTQAGGLWFTPGTFVAQDDKCYIRHTDVGNACTAKEQCQGLCNAVEEANGPVSATTTTDLGTTITQRFAAQGVCADITESICGWHWINGKPEYFDCSAV